MQKRKKESIMLPRLLKKIAPRIGASVLIEPEWGVAGRIRFPAKGGSVSGGKDSPSGKLGASRYSYFRYNTLDLNPVGASDVAKDKDYAAFFMRALGYPAVRGKAFFSDDWCETIQSERDAKAAARYARRRYPVVVKPNSGSQGGDIHVVHNERELLQAAKRIFKRDRIMLVQPQLKGRDYRLVVLDDEVISAYERIPLSVVGDGRSTILQLLKKKQRAFDKDKRDTRIKLADPRIRAKLVRQGLALPYKPDKGERVFLLDNANLSSGGDAVDITRELHPAWKKLAVKLTRDMNLRLAGVDIMTGSDITKPPKAYHILEINAAPGLDHYVKGGKTQQKIVENLYLKVLRHIAQ
ncbi:MAG: cyanophycin synthetase [Patescibacteria group bacterium]|nr:cyanophycin synthetase [Patescibacteria group bacterium]